jgi:inosine/xanthosine triphosphatase
MGVIVAVASRNPNKLRAVEKAYMLFGIPASVVAAAKPAALPPQPIGLDAVVEGAVKRAEAALQAVAEAEHGVGIEAGVVAVAGRHLDITVAAVADRSGEVTLGFGPAFQVPTVFLGEVLRGVELGVLAERHFRRGAVGYREGIIGLLTRRRVTRLDLNLAAVAMALVPRLPYNRSLYGNDAT